MSEADRTSWDARYASTPNRMGEAPKAVVLAWADALPRQGRALDVAAGEGQLAAWLARRGLSVDAVEISTVALDRLRVRTQGLAVRAHAADLDHGLPAELDGYDLITCIHYWDAALLRSLCARLRPLGLLLVEVLASPPVGRFRAEPEALREAAHGLEILRFEILRFEIERFDKPGDPDRPPVARLLGRKPATRDRP